MANIYLKSAENTLILAPREGFYRQFDFDAWTEMRVGMYFSGVSSSGDNAQNTDETVALSTYADRVCFGIKSTSGDIPGVAGTDFIGATNPFAAVSDATTPAFGCTDGVSFNRSLAAAVSVGTSFTSNALVASNRGLRFPSNVTGTTTYCGFYALKFVIANIGTASQSVTITCCSENNVSGSDYSASALLTSINNGTYATMGAAIAWNNGAAAYDIPDNVFVRVPFYNNRLRISAIRAVRYA